MQLLIREVRPLGPPHVSRAVTANAKIALTAEDRVRKVVHKVNSYRSTPRHPTTPGVTHRSSPSPKRQAIKKVSLNRPGIRGGFGLH